MQPASAFTPPVSDSAPTPSMPAAQEDLYPKLDEQTVLEQFQARAAASLAHSDPWRKEAKELYDFVSGRQWDTDDEADRKSVV